MPRSPSAIAIASGRKQPPRKDRSARGPQPYVKWSHEPPRAQDVPLAIARAIHHASLPPRGPAFVSIPMDDWDADADEQPDQSALARAITGRALPDPVALEDLAQLIER